MACYRRANERVITAGGIHGKATSAWEFFGQRTERYAAMAKQVDEINVMAHGPQEYLRAVVLPPNSM